MSSWTMGTEAWIVMAMWAALMLVVVWLLVREPRHDPRADADAILRDRFARGELSEEEFRRATAALAAHRGAVSGPSPRDHAARHVSDGQEARHDR